MDVSQAGIDLVKRHEGCVLTAYQDSAGIWTIGYGSTRGVQPGMTITQAEADERLRRDLADAVDCINDQCDGLNQNQFDALVDFVFNIGCGAFENSTLLRLLKRGYFSAAAQEFGKWTRAGDTHPPGLLKRRADEAMLFESVESPT